MITVEVWDTSTGNYITSYSDLTTALNDIHMDIMENGSEAWKNMTLLYIDEDDSGKNWSVTGQDLVEYAVTGVRHEKEV